MCDTDRKASRWTGAFLLGLSFLPLPSALSAQSSDDALMRLVCFDSTQTANSDGWVIVVTQMSNEEYPADIFFPDSDGAYADRFPMFSNTGFFFSVFENVPTAIASDDTAAFAADLFQNNPSVTTRLAEGSRVGTLLDLTLEGSGMFKFDSQDPSMNFFTDPQFGDERVPVCEPPFPYQPNLS